MKKRFFSFAMALCLMLAFLPGNALAAQDDTTPPAVTGIYMNSPGGVVTAGTTLYFDVGVEDESDISSVSLEFKIKDSQDNYNVIYARMDSYDAESKTARAKLEITDRTASATWVLVWVSVEDCYGNTSSISSYKPGDFNFESITFTVCETVKDATEPVIKAIKAVDPKEQVTAGDTLYFDIMVEDESDILSASLEFKIKDSENNNNTIYANMDSYDAESKTARAKLEITDRTASATWVLVWVSVEDCYGNTSSISSYKPGDFNFESITFTVCETVKDATEPVIKAIKAVDPKEQVTAGDTLYFDVIVEDESDISSVSLEFKIKDSQDNYNAINAYMDSYDAESKTARAKLEITDRTVSATWTLEWISVEDQYGNTSTFRSSRPGNLDFNSVTFTVASLDIPTTSVSVPESLTLPVRTVQTIYPTVTPANSLPGWTWTSDNTNVVEVTKAENGKACLITALGTGTATITGTTQNGLTASCQVTVTDAPLPESGEIEESCHVNVGGFVDIVPALSPEDATAFFEVTSDNPHVASAKLKDNGTSIRVEGVNAGHATVIIRTSNGIVMTTTVTVGKETDTQHEKMTVPGWEPTCVSPGRTDEVRCSACWYVFTPSEEIPATGQHTFGEWQVQREPTATEEGLRARSCEVCGFSETESIPATGGSSSSGSTGGSTGGGGGGSVGGGGSIGGVTAPSAGQNTTVQSGGQDFSATVKDGTVSVTANDSEVDSMIDSASSGVVELDASAVDAAGVSLPQNIISAVSESEDVSGVTLKTAQGSVALSGDVVDTLADAMTGENDILTLTVDTIDPDVIPDTQKYPIASALKSAVFVELSAAIEHRNASGSVTSTEKLHELGGSVTVSVPFELPDSMDGRQIVACYIADDGSITYFPVKYENGAATFTTTHFSTYAIVESRAAAFKDVDVGAWYTLSLEYALEHDLMRGVSTQEFAPGDSATRGMIATVLYRLEGEPAVTGESGFEDVAPGLWYTDAITWAAGRKILQGQGNGLCGPMDPVTREQMAVLLWRYADEPESTTDLSQFPDAGKVSSWADTAVRWAVETGILKGKEDGSLAPGGTASRAEIATILMRFRESVLEKD